jgi:hypothetical protein
MSRGISGKMLAAIKSLYSDARIAVKVSGHVGDSMSTSSGVRQGCPLSPTLFGIYIDALESWLRQQVPGAGVPLTTPRGVTRLLAALIYADDIVLMDSTPANLQRLLDSLAAFCTACGLDISRSKTKVMQFLPPRQCSQPQHTFNIGAHTLEVVDSYKYLGVHFHSSGNPAAYMTVALRSLDCSYARMRRQYCGMACGSNLQLQLRFFDALVTSSALSGAELCGVHSSTGRQRKKFASRYVKHLKQLCGLPRSTPTETFLLELGWLSLPDRWLQSCIRFWNQLLALPADDLYRDVLFDSASTGIGFAKHMQQACNASGSTLNLCILPPGGGGGLAAAPLDILQLRRLDSSAIMQQRHAQQEQRLEAAALDPRTCPSKGAATCKYLRWFRRSNAQRQAQGRYSSSLLSLPASARKINLVLRFRLGCLRQLPVVQGRHDNVPREQRFCRHCPCHVGDEKHLIFDCPAFNFLREHHARLFEGRQTVRGFMNQDSQKGVLHFICDCLDHDLLLASLVGAVAP